MLSMTTIFCFFALHSPRNVVISSSSSRWNLGLQSRSWLFLHSSHSYNSLKYSQEIGIVEYWHQKGMDLVCRNNNSSGTWFHPNSIAKLLP